jgi:hypothetical protein
LGNNADVGGAGIGGFGNIGAGGADGNDNGSVGFGGVGNGGPGGAGGAGGSGSGGGLYNLGGVSAPRALPSAAAKIDSSLIAPDLHRCLLAAGWLGFCQQFFRFAQEALSRRSLRPARILHPLP